MTVALIEFVPNLCSTAAKFTRLSVVCVKTGAYKTLAFIKENKLTDLTRRALDIYVKHTHLLRARGAIFGAPLVEHPGGKRTHSIGKSL